MKIEVCGSGCPKCKSTLENARLAVQQMGIDAEVIPVFDVKEVVKKGISKTPAILVDGRVKSVGRVPEVEEIKGFLTEAIKS